MTPLSSHNTPNRPTSHCKSYFCAGSKRADYAAAGIPEYWIVDARESRISVLTLEGESYATLGEFTPGQKAASRLLDGFAVDVTAVFDAAEPPV